MKPFDLFQSICVLLGIGIVKGSIEFFDHAYSHQRWDSIQNSLDETFSDGEFVDSWSIPNFIPMFWHPCVPESTFMLTKWVYGNCHDSESVRGNLWSWKPNKRKSHYETPWSPENMCRLMNGRNLVFIGDSLSEQMYYIFLSAMHRDILIPKDRAYDKEYIDKKRGAQWDQCDNFCNYWHLATCREDEITLDCGSYPSFKVSLIKDDHLDLNTWWPQFGSRNVSLAIINTGAHFVNDSVILANVEDSVKKLHSLNISVIFRTTSPGHPRCETLQHTRPLTAESSKRYNYTYDSAVGNYHYAEFIGQTLKVVDMLHTKHPAVLIMNVHNSTSRRVDVHPVLDHDCLHYCIPGPLVEWVSFMYLTLSEAVEFHGSSTPPYQLRTASLYYDTNDTIHDSSSVHVTLPVFVDTTMVEGSLFRFHTKDKMYNFGGDGSVFTWVNGSRHRIDEEYMKLHNVDWYDVQKFDVWKFINLPPGRPFYYNYTIK